MKNKFLIFILLFNLIVVSVFAAEVEPVDYSSVTSGIEGMIDGEVQEFLSFSNYLANLGFVIYLLIVSILIMTAHNDERRMTAKKHAQFLAFNFMLWNWGYLIPQYVIGILFSTVFGGP